jgi:hypothetical protein
VREIPLTRGKVALVDDEDYEWLSHFRWSYMTKGYAARTKTRNGTHSVLYMHRVIMLPDPDQQIDHINRDTLDNRRRNLRVCTNRQNIAAGIFPPGQYSRHRGVTWDKSRRMWSAQVKHRPQQLALGRFDNEVDAALAYDIKAIELFGEFARPNFLRATA